MVDVETLVRANIKRLKPYQSARDEYKGREGIFLDANENPFGEFNRYPDPYQLQLKQILSKIKNVSVENIFVGNGSDEVIDLALRIFCEPGVDKVIICPPTYGMYEVSANINNVEIISIPLKPNFQLDIDKILSVEARMLFICSPNNPTGNCMDGIDTILENFNGIVFVDEAYIDFSSQPSLLSWLGKYPNLIISQTLSKAWAHAGIRVGLAYASEKLISYYNKVKPPYNISELNQKAAIDVLQKNDEIRKDVKLILAERERLINELKKLSMITKIYPTEANFVLVECTNAQKVYDELIASSIIIRNRSSVVKGGLRITVGTPKENDVLINELKKIK